MPTSHYELLGIDPSASAEDVKRAFRKEIAKYHPDKVQHLGREFQEIAEVRSAELTEAYRILMDPAQRADYDEQLTSGPAPGATTPAERPPSTPSAAARRAEAPPETPRTDPQPPPKSPGEATGREFVRRVAVAKFRAAVQESLEDPESVTARDFDLGYLSRPRRGLFKKGEAPVTVLGRFVSEVDASAVQATWPLAARVGPPADGSLCVFLLGGRLAPQGELAGAIADQRRKQPRGASVVVVVPVDVRDWEALLPTDAPPVARRILHRLRQ